MLLTVLRFCAYSTGNLVIVVRGGFRDGRVCHDGLWESFAMPREEERFFYDDSFDPVGHWTLGRWLAYVKQHVSRQAEKVAVHLKTRREARG